MNVEDFLSRLQNVRRVGHGRWIASCPAHDDAHPSMNIKEEPDKILFLCRAGCRSDQVVKAMGLQWRDVFTEQVSVGSYNRSLNRAFPAADVLEALGEEALVVAVAASNIAAGVELTEEDRKRVLQAANRIDSARRLTLGRR